MHTCVRVQICAAMTATFVLWLAAPAAAQNGKRPDLKEEGRKLFDKTRPAGDGRKDSASTSGWAVAVFTFRGDERTAESRRVLEYVRTEGMLREARMEERGPSVVILVGSFADPQSAEAKAELDRIRKITVTGEADGRAVQNQPYTGAFLAPPNVVAGEGKRPEINLLRVREQQPGALYSLQVAAYAREDIDRPTEDDLKEARRSAEQAALQLRSEGEQAYYYHGPRMSLVTIGAFDLTDYDPQMPNFTSERLRELRKRHPLNLYNGKAIKEKRPGQKDQLQTSKLVDLPKK